MSVNRLYDSTVQAFPNTRKRQYATDALKVVSLHWTPFVGLRTMFIKGVVESDANVYDTVLLFRDVDYDVERNSGNVIPLVATDGMTYHFGKLSPAQNDVLVRCNCNDFRWRWNYYNHLDGSLWGRKARKYESKGGPPANPREMPGMCKHLIKTVSAMYRAGAFS